MFQHPSTQEPPLRHSSHKNSKPNSRHRRPMESAEARAFKPQKELLRTPPPQKSQSFLRSSGERYAGGAYQNSPTAGSLPVPTFEDTPPPVSKSPPSFVSIEALFLENSGICNETDAKSSVATASIPAFVPSPPPSPVTVTHSTLPDFSSAVPVARPLFNAPFPSHQHYIPPPNPMYANPFYPQPFPAAHHEPQYHPYNSLHSSSAPQFLTPSSPAPPTVDPEASSILRAVLKIQS